MVLGFKVAGSVADVRVTWEAASPRVRSSPRSSTDLDPRVRRAEAALTQARVRLGLSAPAPTHGGSREHRAVPAARRDAGRAADPRSHEDVRGSVAARRLTRRKRPRGGRSQYQDAWKRSATAKAYLPAALRARDRTPAAAGHVLRSPPMRCPRAPVAAGEYRAPGNAVMTVVRTTRCACSRQPERDTPGPTTGLPARASRAPSPSTRDGSSDRRGHPRGEPHAADRSGRPQPGRCAAPGPVRHGGRRQPRRSRPVVPRAPS